MALQDITLKRQKGGSSGFVLQTEGLTELWFVVSCLCQRCFFSGGRSWGETQKSLPSLSLGAPRLWEKPRQRSWDRLEGLISVSSVKGTEGPGIRTTNTYVVCLDKLGLFLQASIPTSKQEGVFRRHSISLPGLSAQIAWEVGKGPPHVSGMWWVTCFLLIPPLTYRYVWVSMW